ncbi:MAG: YihY/virulence factor BrkB family protein [Chloroherpetonaceae bacterium]|nr:YihY/virulence factor BrkB family protein [Chloroherpetonaceae bacterium]
MKNAIRVLKIFAKKFTSSDSAGLAAEMSYSLILSLFPLLLLFVSILSMWQSPGAIASLSRVLGAILPPDIHQPIDKTIQSILRESDKSLLTLSLIFSLFSIFTVFNVVIKAMERIYEVKQRLKFFSRIRISIELGLIIGISFLIVFNLLIFGYEVEEFLVNEWKWLWAKTAFQIIKFPIAFLVMVYSALMVYKFSLRVGQKLECVIPGAFVMALLWTVLNANFGLYLQYQRFGTYTQFVKLIVLPLWMYANAMVFLIGAHINWMFYTNILQPEMFKRKKVPRTSRTARTNS